MLQKCDKNYGFQTCPDKIILRDSYSAYDKNVFSVKKPSKIKLNQQNYIKFGFSNLSF